MASTVKAVTQTAFKPVVKLGSVLHAGAIKRTGRYTDEFAQNMARHNVEGTDMAATMTNQFINNQVKMVPYRVERAGDELKYIMSGQYCKKFGLTDLVVELRFISRLFFLFMTFCILGRKSIYPLIGPDSQFAEGFKFKVNPNFQ